MTKAETALLLQTIMVLYPASKLRADELTVGLWHEMLRDIPGELAGLAVRRMAAVLKYPPSVADIREAVATAEREARGELSAGDAWAQVMRAVRQYGYYRPEEAHAALGDDIWRVVMMLGGWDELCMGEGALAVKSAQFERRYQAYVDQRAQAVQIPAAVRERMAALMAPAMQRMIGGETDAG